MRMTRFSNKTMGFLAIFGGFAAVAGSGTVCGAPEWKEAYDPLIVRTLHLQVEEADWDRVRFDQPVEGQTEGQERAEAWFHGEGESAIRVEIRRKGQTDPALPDEGNPQKVSLKIDMNAIVPGQRWHGLRKLSLENGGDIGPLQEGFAWQIHRMAADAGYYRYDAANAAWVRLYLNGNLLGVFVSTEQRDEQLLRNRDLYSPYDTWLYKIDGGTYLEVGTGDSTTHTHLSFPPFNSKPGGGGRPGGGGTTPDLDADLPQWIDMESMLTLAACEAFVENNDGLFTHSGKNSFAADFNPPNLRRRLYFPWDMDASIKDGNSGIYGSEPYQTQILGHAWFGRVYEHTLRELLAGPLATASLHAFLDQLEPVLGPALEADPYAAPEGGSAAAFADLRDWAARRTANVATKFVHPFVPRPVLSHPGGEVASGFALAMAAASGQIYFTTNGSDPRAPGGGLSAGAMPYSGPLVVDRGMKVVARARDGTTWSGLATEAAFTVAESATPLRISEIMYHPLDPDPSDGIDKDAYEFIELHNPSASTVDLSRYFFDGIAFFFPDGTVLDAGERLVLVRGAAAFENRYPGVAYHGTYFGGLSNSGEKIRLKNADGTTLISVEYDDDPPWVLSPDGMGYSLVNHNPDGDPDEAANWRASRNIGGSPGAADPEPTHPTSIVLNEVLAHAAAPCEGAVELHNPTDVGADLGGWFLSNEARTPLGDLSSSLLKKFRLPAGLVVPAGGFAVLYERDFNFSNPLVPFALNPHGGRVYLSSADTAGNLTGTILALEFPATDPNTSYGFIATSDGPRATLLAAPSFGVPAPATVEDFRAGAGAPNPQARVGPIVLSEIHYNPQAADSEFLELHNLSSAPVDISGWDIDGAEGFRFPSGTVVPAGGFAVLVDTAKTTAEAFRSARAIASEVPVFGHLFDLANDGESLRIEKPNPVAFQPDILIERVRYNDKPPWPNEADGAGPSLERLPPSTFGDEPLHWKAVSLRGTPGRLGDAGLGQAVVAGSSWDYKATAASLGTIWKEPGYNATAWVSATAPAGYGEPFLASTLPYGPDAAAKFPTTYFRKAFVLADDPASLASLTLSLLYDDGVAVYLNGTEVVRRGLPAGEVTYSSLAAADIEAVTPETVDLSAFRHLLVQGVNVLAAEVHQVDGASSDLVWDASLTYALAVNPDDQDGDGLPRDWEIANGLNDNDPDDAIQDPDLDGQDNATEFLAGTDPRDGSSFFRIESLELAAGGGATLRWASVPGRTYQILYSPDLSDWFGFGAAGEVTAIGATTEFHDPGSPAPDRRFYIIRVIR